MRRGRGGRIALPAAAAALLLGAGCTLPQEEARLAVVVVVDQLTPDLLERYEPAFEDGLRRLLDEGHLFTDAVHDHAITFTGPGHATVSTGVLPARHGIVANSWREQGEEGGWSTVSAVADGGASVVGGGGSGVSPANLLRDGVADWLVAAHPEARVVSLSGKAPAAILLAGRARGHAYWFSTGAGGFVTSDFYRDALPDWVQAFNETAVERYVGDGCWRSDLPPETAALSRRDTVGYEADGAHVHFPHCEADAPYNSAAHFISRTPAMDEITLGLAAEAVRALELGRREAPDLLALGLSATDRIGHTFGPYSREQLDNLVRLDRSLGDLMRLLDEEVGAGRYVVALTSDHGVLPLPEYLEELGEPGRRVASSELNQALSAASEVAGPSGLEAGEAGAEARSRLARELEEVEWIEQVVTLEELAGPQPADSFVDLYRRSYHPGRHSARFVNYGVEIRPSEGFLVRGSGTTHGQPYLHDRAVPILFFGAGVAAGRTGSPARTVDVAPTVAALLGVAPPADLDGRALVGERAVAGSR